MIRTISLIQVASLQFEVSTLLYLPENTICVFMDGTIKQSAENTYLLIFIQAAALVILQFGVEGGSGPLTTRVNGEVFLIMLVNLVALTYVLIGIDWLVTVVAWELFNLSLYLLVSMQRAANTKEVSLSASVKYFLLSAYTTSFLLLAIALLYGLTGTTSYDGLIMIAQTGELSLWPFGLVVLTLLFKLGAAPLHNWGPDLYDSLPTLVTMWMMIVPKSAVLFLLLQLDFVVSSENPMLLVFGTISMIVGSLGLSSQWKIKRFIAYSGITNVGFIQVAMSNPAVSYFYITVYMITSLVLFGIILSISTGSGVEVDKISDLSGLYTRNPGLAYALAICFFSLMGCPPLIGFFPKLAVIANLIDQGVFAVLIVLIICSVVSAANYLSVILVAHLDKAAYNEVLVISYRNGIMIATGAGFIGLVCGLQAPHNLVEGSLLLCSGLPVVSVAGGRQFPAAPKGLKILSKLLTFFCMAILAVLLFGVLMDETTSAYLWCASENTGTKLPELNSITACQSTDQGLISDYINMASLTLWLVIGCVFIIIYIFLMNLLVPKLLTFNFVLSRPFLQTWSTRWVKAYAFTSRFFYIYFYFLVATNTLVGLGYIYWLKQLQSDLQVLVHPQYYSTILLCLSLMVASLFMMGSISIMNKYVLKAPLTYSAAIYGQFLLVLIISAFVTLSYLGQLAKHFHQPVVLASLLIGPVNHCSSGPLKGPHSSVMDESAGIGPIVVTNPTVTAGPIDELLDLMGYVGFVGSPYEPQINLVYINWSLCFFTVCLFYLTLAHLYYRILPGFMTHPVFNQFVQSRPLLLALSKTKGERYYYPYLFVLVWFLLIVGLFVSI